MNADTLLARLHELGAAILASQPAPSHTVLLAVTVLGALLVLPARVWHITRHAITIFHEGGHSLVSMLLGEKGQKIHLNMDTSGYTNYMAARGPFSFVRMVLSASAGYPAACVLGLVFAFMLSYGHAAASLLLLLLCLVGVLVQVRNLWGWISVLTTLLVLLLTTWLLPDEYQTALASVVAVFLLLGGLRTAWEQRLSVIRYRRQRLPDGSDARAIAQRLHLPVAVTLWYFIVFNTLCVAVAYWVLTVRGRWL